MSIIFTILFGGDAFLIKGRSLDKKCGLTIDILLSRHNYFFSKCPVVFCDINYYLCSLLNYLNTPRLSNATIFHRNVLTQGDINAYSDRTYVGTGTVLIQCKSKGTGPGPT